MKILLNFLKISTSKGYQDDNSGFIDEGFVDNSSTFNTNIGLKKRPKPLRHSFKNMAEFIDTLSCNKRSKTTSENNLAGQ